MTNDMGGKQKRVLNQIAAKNAAENSAKANNANNKAAFAKKLDRAKTIFESADQEKNSWQYKPDGSRKTFAELSTPEVFTWISTLNRDEQAGAVEQFYSEHLSNPASVRYDPYYTTGSNNAAARELFGVDRFDQAWIDANRSTYMPYVTFSGEKYTTPKTPGKTASDMEKAAYEYWLIANTYEQTTQAAEAEYAKLREEIAEEIRIETAMGDGVTADEILQGIDWSEYKTLANLREASAAGNGRYLNRPVQVGDASLRAMINAAMRGEDIADAKDYIDNEVQWILSGGERARAMNAGAEAESMLPPMTSTNQPAAETQASADEGQSWWERAFGKIGDAAVAEGRALTGMHDQAGQTDDSKAPSDNGRRSVQDAVNALRESYSVDAAISMIKSTLKWPGTDLTEKEREELKDQLELLEQERAERSQIEEEVREDLRQMLGERSFAESIIDYVMQKAIIGGGDLVPTYDYDAYLRSHMGAEAGQNPEMAKYDAATPAEERAALLAEGVATGFDKAATASTQGAEYMLYNILRLLPGAEGKSKEEIYAENRYLAALSGWNRQFDREWIEDEDKQRLTEEYPVFSMVSAGVSELIKMTGLATGASMGAPMGAPVSAPMGSYAASNGWYGFDLLKNGGKVQQWLTTKLGTAAQAMPFYMDVYAQTYDTAIQEGATEDQAAMASGLNAMISGTLSSATVSALGKLGGSITRLFSKKAGQAAATQGLIGLVKGNKWVNALFAIGRSALEEGLEEAAEEPIGSGIAKLIYDPDRAWFGAGGVFDSKKMLQSGIGGAIVGPMFTLASGASGLLGEPSRQKAEDILDRTSRGELVPLEEIEELAGMEAREAEIQDVAAELTAQRQPEIDAAGQRAQTAMDAASKAREKLEAAQAELNTRLEEAQPIIRAINEGTASYSDPEVIRELGERSAAIDAAREMLRTAEIELAGIQADTARAEQEAQGIIDGIRADARSQATRMVDAVRHPRRRNIAWTQEYMDKRMAAAAQTNEAQTEQATDAEPEVPQMIRLSPEEERFNEWLNMDPLEALRQREAQLKKIIEEAEAEYDRANEEYTLLVNERVTQGTKGIHGRRLERAYAARENARTLMLETWEELDGINAAITQIEESRPAAGDQAQASAETETETVDETPDTEPDTEVLSEGTGTASGSASDEAIPEAGGSADQNADAEEGDSQEDQTPRRLFEEARRLRLDAARMTRIINQFTDMINSGDIEANRASLVAERDRYVELRDERLQRARELTQQQMIAIRANAINEAGFDVAEESAIWAREADENRQIREEMAESISRNAGTMRDRLHDFSNRLRTKMRDYNMTSTVGADDVASFFEDLEGDIQAYGELERTWSRRQAAASEQLELERRANESLRRQLNSTPDSEADGLRRQVLESTDRINELTSAERIAGSNARYYRRCGAESLQNALREGRLPQPVMERIITMCADAGRRGRFNLSGVMEAGADALIHATNFITRTEDALIDSSEALRLNSTMAARVWDDIFGDAAPIMRGLYYDPVMDSETERMRWIADWRERIAALNLTKAESELVQRVGEGIITLEEGVEAGAQERIGQAVALFREFYDSTFEQANEALVRNGYERFGRISNYFPHIREAQGFFERIGLPITNPSLPTSINGLTETFSPGRQYSPHIQHREGETTDFDALAGFEEYIGTISGIMFHTDNIQRLRQLETEIRAAADLGLFRSALNGDGRNHLNEFVKWIHEYTNLLAGKKSSMDRGTEGTIGRVFYRGLNGIRSARGQSAVMGNLSSAITNMVPVSQIIAEHPWDALRACSQLILSGINGRGNVPESQFMIRRFGSDSVVQTTYTRFKHAMSVPFEVMDHAATNIVVYSYYQANLRMGMDNKTAMRSADAKAARLMGDRSKGAQANIYGSQIISFLTQFQYEVANQSQHFRKDLPRQYSAGRCATVMMMTALWGYIFNEIQERITGQRSAADPIQMVIETWEACERVGTDGYMPVVSSIYNNVSELFPVIGSGGRIAAFDPISSVFEAVETGSGIGYPLAQLVISFTPVGGQVKKSVEGIRAIINQGVYNANGTQLKYAVDTSDPYDNAQLKTAVQSVLFGPGSTQAAVDYYAGTAPGLTEAKTRAYQQDLDRGMTPTEAYRNEADRAEAEKLESAANATDKAAAHAEGKREAGRNVDNADNSQTDSQREQAAELRSKAVPGDLMGDRYWQLKDEPAMQNAVALWRTTGKEWMMPEVYDEETYFDMDLDDKKDTDKTPEYLTDEMIDWANKEYEARYMTLMGGIDPQALTDEQMAELQKQIKKIKTEIDDRLKEQLARVRR